MEIYPLLQQALEFVVAALLALLISSLVEYVVHRLMHARVVLGKLYPNQCRLYGLACTPRKPVGPCMVSDEGACRIWWSGGVRQNRHAAERSTA